MVESSLVTYKGGIIDYNVGTPASVEFNFERIWIYKRHTDKLARLLNKPSQKFHNIHLKFHHVHPSGFLTLSELDHNCMEGLRIALGEPIQFSIYTFDNSDPLDVDNIKYNSYAHYHHMTEDVGENHRLSHSQLILLKRLAYGTTKL